MKILKKSVFLLIAIFIQACAYKGELGNEYKSKINIGDNYPLKVALIETSELTQELKTTNSNWHVSISTGNFILDALKKELSNKFRSVEYIKDNAKLKDFDLIIEPHFSIEEDWSSSNGDFRYTGHLTLLCKSPFDKSNITGLESPFVGDFYNSESRKNRADICVYTLGLGSFFLKAGIEEDLGADAKSNMKKRLTELVQEIGHKISKDKKLANYAKRYKYKQKMVVAKKSIKKYLVNDNKNTNNYALIIGNNDYINFPSLKTPVNDALAISNILHDDYNFKTYLLENATRADIIAVMSDLKRDLTPTDNLLIYYAGHGWLDKAEDEGYWLPVNAKKDDESAWLSNSTITTKLKAMDANHIFVIADSCYSGKLTRGVGLKEKKKGDDYSKRGRSVLSSGGLEPVVDDGGKNNHSIFLSTILDSLKNNQGTLTAEQLYKEIKRPIELEADQTPEYADIRKAGHEGGEFLFIKK